MNKFLPVTILFFGLLMSTTAQEFKGTAAAKVFAGADWIRIKSGKEIPGFIRLNPGSQFDNKDLQNWMTRHFSLSDVMSFTRGGIEKDARMGMTHTRYKQTYKTVPVWDADFITHERNSKVESINGTMYRTILEGNTVEKNENEALDLALAYMKASLYKWEIPGEDELLKQMKNDETATHFPKGKLVLFPVSEGIHHYAWMFTVYAVSPLKKSELFVDAQSGVILRDNNKIYESDSTGIALTKYVGQKSIETELYNETIFRLRETGRGSGIETYNLLNGDNYNNAVDFTDDDNFWDNVNSQQDEIATDAHYGAEMTYDYFKIKHGRNSLDDQGYLLRSYVHFLTDFANAFWDGQVMTYGDGGNGYTPFTTMDICGHEITHGLDEFTANLTYSYESGALNEGYSDIFGVMVEFYGDTLGADWLMGEDIGSPFRSMSDPNTYGQPDTYLGDQWATGGSDNGGVHTNSGVINFWFYLTSQGGTGVNDNNDSYAVTGIGKDKAAEVAYRTLTIYLNPNDQYEDARFYSIVSAVDLFGECTPEVESVTNAMHAVGIGNPFSLGVSCDFDVALQDYCSLPAVVSFMNETNNGLSFHWDFGDGSSSSLFEPTHQYTSAGLFTVTLIADGGDCGSDTLIKTNYITVNPPQAPVVTSAAHCGGPASLTLSAMASDSVLWFTAPSGGTAIHAGTSFTTPVLDNTTIYYVENQEIVPPAYVGKTSKGTDGSYYANFNSHYLAFDVLAPVTIRSVKVYADVEGWRFLELRDSQGVPLISTNVNIPLGESRVILDYDVLPGTGYRLAAQAEPSLYRDRSGGNYPYTIPGLISITHCSSTGANATIYYPFFYDWEVYPQSCISERVSCTAFINSGLPQASFSSTALPPGLTVVFDNTSTDGISWLWNFGDGATSTEKTPTHTFPGQGIYQVSLEATNACGSVSVTHEQIIVVGIDDIYNDNSLRLVPNPASSFVQAWFKLPAGESAHLVLIDMLGQVQYEIDPPAQSGEQSLRIPIEKLGAGVYSVLITTNKRKMMKRLVVE